MISIIIPNLNNAHRLDQCLQAVLSECAGRSDVEVIVVENGSVDDSVAVAEGYGVEVLVDKRLTSPFTARNTGIGRASGNVVVLLDSNCVPLHGWLSAGLAKLNEGYDVVSGQLTFEPIRERDFIGKFDALYAIIPTDNQRQYKAFPGGNLFVRATIFQQHGVFVESLRGLGDIEWTQRVARNGGRLGLATGALARYPAKSGWAFARKMFRLGRGHKEWGIYLHGTLYSSGYAWRVIKKMLPPSPEFIDRMYRLGQSEKLPIPWLVVVGLCYLTKVLRGLGMVFGKVDPGLYHHSPQWEQL